MSGRECSGITNERWPRACHRLATEEVDGRWYCKSHAAGRKRRKANDQKNREKQAAASAANEAVQRRITGISAKLGISVREHINDHRSFKGGAGIVYDDRFALVSLDDLERLGTAEEPDIA